MKFYVALVFVLFLALWCAAIALFSGVIPASVLPGRLADLAATNSFEGIGNAMATLDGLFSSIAILLGLIAILLQGKELNASTQAQTEQSEALSRQILQQEASNRLGAYSARLQFLSAEIEHMEARVKRMVEQAGEHKEKGAQDKAGETWNVIKSTRNKIERYRKEAAAIDDEIRKLLG